MLDDGAPEDQHVDPRVAAMRGGVLGYGERRLRRRRSPGLDPWDTAGLQLGDDLVGDFLVKPRSVTSGTSVSGVSGHRGSPRRAPRASLAISQPVTANPSALSLSHCERCELCPQTALNLVAELSLRKATERGRYRARTTVGACRSDTKIGKRTATEVSGRTVDRPDSMSPSSVKPSKIAESRSGRQLSSLNNIISNMCYISY